MKVETLAAAALLKISFLIKFATYSVSKGLYTLMSSDVHLFHEFFEEPTDKAIKPVTLCILVTSEDHLNKTVVSPWVGAYVKGDDSLPQRVKETAKL